MTQPFFWEKSKMGTQTYLLTWYTNMLVYLDYAEMFVVDQSDA